MCFAVFIIYWFFRIYTEDTIVLGFTPLPLTESNSKINITIAIIPGASDSQSQNPYNSSRITVSEGSTVGWLSNDGAAHIIASGDADKGPSNVFYSPALGFGEEFSFLF